MMQVNWIDLNELQPNQIFHLSTNHICKSNVFPTRMSNEFTYDVKWCMKRLKWCCVIGRDSTCVCVCVMTQSNGFCYICVLFSFIVTSFGLAVDLSHPTQNAKDWSRWLNLLHKIDRDLLMPTSVFGFDNIISVWNGCRRNRVAPRIFVYFKQSISESTKTNHIHLDVSFAFFTVYFFFVAIANQNYGTT